MNAASVTHPQLYSQPVIASGALEHPRVQLPSQAITTRGITEETLARYGAVNPGILSTIATPVIKYEVLIGWKYRTGGWANSAEKECYWAKGSERWLIGTQLWSGKSTKVYVCEGETDMWALSQHVPSTDLVVCFGGNPTDAQLREWLDWVAYASSETYLCFDNDAAGAEYFDRCAEYWGNRPNVFTLQLPPNVKDVAELLLNCGELEWGGFPVMPSTLISGIEVMEEHTADREDAVSTGDIALDRLIEGHRPGKIILVAGMPKEGKSAYMAYLTASYIMEHKLPVMFFALELTRYQTLQRINSINPGLMQYITFVKKFGYVDTKFLEKHLRYCKMLGIKLVVIDHVTSACTQPSTEGLTTQALDGFMYTLQAVANDLGLYVLAVSHVNAACKGIVHPTDLRGSLSLVQVPDVVLGIRRLDDGVAEVRTVCPDRVVGIHGTIVYRFDECKYSPIELKGVGL